MISGYCRTGINHIVLLSADFVNCFKNRLHKYWRNQDIIYDCQADIHGN